MVNAQAPDSFQYQAVARDATGNILDNKAVVFKISILQGSASGTVLYSEYHSIATNEFGLVSFEIGNGVVNLGSMSSIDWDSDSYFLQVELDPEGGVNFQYMGTSQLLSVPYALHAKTVELDLVDDADADPTNELQVISLSGNDLILSNDGGTVTLNETGDDWGSQTVLTDATLSGNGTDENLLKIDQQNATEGQWRYMGVEQPYPGSRREIRHWGIMTPILAGDMVPTTIILQGRLQ